MKKEKLDTKKLNAIKEHNSLTKRTMGLELEEEGKDFFKQIHSCKTEQELNKIRTEMFLAYCQGVLEPTEELIDSFSNRLADVKEYNERLMELDQEFDKITELDGINEEDVNKCKNLFTKILDFFVKTQQNEKNIINQSNKEFWSNTYPKWFTIFSVFYINLMGWLFASDKIIFNLKNIGLTILGWLLLGIAIWFSLKIFFYGSSRR